MSSASPVRLPAPIERLCFLTPPSGITEEVRKTVFASAVAMINNNCDSTVMTIMLPPGWSCSEVKGPDIVLGLGDAKQEATLYPVGPPPASIATTDGGDDDDSMILSPPAASLDVSGISASGQERLLRLASLINEAEVQGLDYRVSINVKEPST